MNDNAVRLGFDPDRLALLDKRLREWSVSGMTPSITSVILRRGETAFSGAYGVLGPGRGDGLAPDTIFPICSLTKPVMSTLISVLQEEGLLDLNEPVRKYMPEFTGDYHRQVRLWHLLTHTSGLVDHELPKAEKDEDYWSAALAAPPSHKPLEAMTYCNTGYNMIKEIITRVSGVSVDEFARDKLFAPLKMDDSHFILPKEKTARFVTRGEDFCGSEWLNEGVLNYDGGSGGLKSTAADMVRFGQMYLNGGKLDGVRVLSPASVREISANHNAGVASASYNGEIFESTWGLGWNVRKTKKDDAGMLRSPLSFEHGGYGCVKLMCDPVYDTVAAYFTVCRTDTYYMAANFNNMVIAAITEI